MRTPFEAFAAETARLEAFQDIRIHRSRLPFDFRVVEQIERRQNIGDSSDFGGQQGKHVVLVEGRKNLHDIEIAKQDPEEDTAHERIAVVIWKLGGNLLPVFQPMDREVTDFLKRGRVAASQWREHGYVMMFGQFACLKIQIRFRATHFGIETVENKSYLQSFHRLI